MKFSLRMVAIMILLATTATPNQVYQAPGSPFRTWIGLLSTTPVNVCSGDCYAYAIVAAAGTGSSATLTATDGSGQCSGGGCDLATAIGLTANTTTTILLSGTFAPNGMNVSIGGTGPVHAHILWSSQPPAGGPR